MAYVILTEPDLEPAPQPRCIALTPGFRVGRTEPNDLVLPDVRISRKHVRFELTDQGWEVFDNGSTSGMYVNEERGGESRLLADGDVIRIGGARLEFVDADLPIENG